jgi:hypothetical protein
MFVRQKSVIKDKKGTILLQALKYHGLYCVDHKPTEFTTNLCLDLINIYKQLSYISQKTMKALFNYRMVLGLKLKPSRDKIVYDAYIKSKITCKPLPKESRKRTKAPGDCVYSDVWGLSHHTIDGKYYYITFTDDYLRESMFI